MTNAPRCTCTAVPRMRDVCLVPIVEAHTDFAAGVNCDAGGGGTMGVLDACMRGCCALPYRCSFSPPPPVCYNAATSASGTVMRASSMATSRWQR